MVDLLFLEFSGDWVGTVWETLDGTLFIRRNLMRCFTDFIQTERPYQIILKLWYHKFISLRYEAYLSGILTSSFKFLVSFESS